MKEVLDASHIMKERQLDRVWPAAPTAAAPAQKGKDIGVRCQGGKADRLGVANSGRIFQRRALSHASPGL
jgi:hypothetical protein